MVPLKPEGVATYLMPLVGELMKEPVCISVPPPLPPPPQATRIDEATTVVVNKDFFIGVNLEGGRYIVG